MKKIFVFILLIIITGCSIKSTKKEETYDGKIIGTSNGEKSSPQIKIIHESLNIRSEKNTKSEIKGIVLKDSYFDIVSYEKIDEYLWVEIKTNNNISGYVGSNPNFPYFTILNTKIDYEKPKIEFVANNIKINTREDLTSEFLESLVKVSDDSGWYELKYEISPDEHYSAHIIKLKVIATDKSGNENFVQKNINIVKERVLSNGEFTDLKGVNEIIKIFEKIYSKYHKENDYWHFDQGTSYNSLRINGDNGYCNYDYYSTEDEFKPNSCWDGYRGLSRDMYEEIEPSEKIVFEIVEKIIKEFKEKGYKISDMAW